MTGKQRLSSITATKTWIDGWRNPTTSGSSSAKRPEESRTSSDTVLLPFQGKIVYDGLLSSHNVMFGAGSRRMLNDSYRAVKQGLGIVASLPAEMASVAGKEPVKTTTKRKPRNPFPGR